MKKIINVANIVLVAYLSIISIVLMRIFFTNLISTSVSIVYKISYTRLDVFFILSLLFGMIYYNVVNKKQRMLIVSIIGLIEVFFIGLF